MKRVSIIVVAIFSVYLGEISASTAQKLQSIIIPPTEVVEAPIGDVAGLLQSKSSELDSSGFGVNVILVERTGKPRPRDSEFAPDLVLKLRTIEIPSMEFQDTPFDDALQFLRDLATKNDPDPKVERRGINIVKIPRRGLEVERSPSGGSHQIHLRSC
jgi:hypothetical protein